MEYMKNTTVDKVELPEDSSSVGNLVEVNVEVAVSFFIHSSSRERSNMMLEKEPRDTVEVAKEFDRGDLLPQPRPRHSSRRQTMLSEFLQEDYLSRTYEPFTSRLQSDLGDAHRHSGK